MHCAKDEATGDEGEDGDDHAADDGGHAEEGLKGLVVDVPEGEGEWRASEGE